MWTRFLFAGLVVAVAAYGLDLPKGQIVDDVKCAADPSQGYTLYLPSNYSPSRTWPVLLGFDAGGRGRRAVERFQTAAEKYGYIVAGSNNSRNGPWEISMTAAAAMTADVVKRFSIDPKRMYATGQSGGARVAMRVALDTGKIAGVIASSAVDPDEEVRKSLPFPVFGTAGTEDFNYLELRGFDRITTSPHRVMIFEGVHSWLPVELATQGVEWMEIQGMKSGRRSRDEGLIDKILALRVAQASAEKNELSAYLAFNALATDFQGLRDVTKFAARAAALHSQKGVIDAEKKSLADDQREAKIGGELYDLEGGVLGDNDDRRAACLAQLKVRLPALSQQAKAKEDSNDRRMARRLLAQILAGSRRIEDPEYQELLQKVRPPDQK